MLISAFFCKKIAFFDKNSTFTQSNSMREFSVFVWSKLAVNENVSFTDHASRFRFQPNWPWIGKMVMRSQLAEMNSSPNFFWCSHVSFVNFSYWSTTTQIRDIRNSEYLHGKFGRERMVVLSRKCYFIDPAKKRPSK